MNPVSPKVLKEISEKLHLYPRLHNLGRAERPPHPIQACDRKLIHSLIQEGFTRESQEPLPMLALGVILKVKATAKPKTQTNETIGRSVGPRQK